MYGVFESHDSVRVLVVDDYHPFADLVASEVRKRGWDVRAAYSVEEARKAVEGFRPDVVVLDVVLRNRDLGGFELAAEFERRFPACRFLLMSVSEPEQAHPRYTFMHKFKLMDGLFRFLGSCRPTSKEVEAVEDRG
jgi:CheY-like chemotaxis protein